MENIYNPREFTAEELEKFKEYSKRVKSDFVFRYTKPLYARVVIVDKKLRYNPAWGTTPPLVTTNILQMFKRVYPVVKTAVMDTETTTQDGKFSVSYKPDYAIMQDIRTIDHTCQIGMIGVFVKPSGSGLIAASICHPADFFTINRDYFRYKLYEDLFRSPSSFYWNTNRNTEAWVVDSRLPESVKCIMYQFPITLADQHEHLVNNEAHRKYKALRDKSK